MNVVHETLLSDFLRDIWESGVGSLQTRLLLRWYGQQKLSVAIWRDLQNRFRLIIDEDEGKPEDWRLFYADTGNSLSFACLDLADINKGEGWWEPVDAKAANFQRARKKTDKGAPEAGEAA